MKQPSRHIIIFILSLTFGFAISTLTEQSLLTRNPAAIRQYYDFTNLRGTALQVALKERIISNLEIVKNENDLGLKLGHFAFTNAQDEKKLGCQEYHKVTLQFESADMAVSGEKSKMEVESDCITGEDISMIEPIWIPLSKVYLEKATDGDFQFMESHQTFLRFTNISDEWPKKWNLIGVHLNNAASELNIDRNEVQKILGKPLVLSF